MATKTKNVVKSSQKLRKASAKKNHVDFLDFKIGEKVRTDRKMKGYSIQKLSELSGVSPAGIYKIETNGMVPTVTTLMKVATALERRVSHFVEEDDEYPEFRYICKKDRTVVSIGQEGRTEMVAERIRKGRLESVYRTLKPGSRSKSPLLQGSGEYLIYCLKGELTVSRGDQNYRLKEGDSFHSESNGRTNLTNMGRLDSRFLVVNTIPQAI